MYIYIIHMPFTIIIVPQATHVKMCNMFVTSRAYVSLQEMLPIPFAVIQYSSVATNIEHHLNIHTTD